MPTLNDLLWVVVLNLAWIVAFVLVLYSPWVAEWWHELRA